MTEPAASKTLTVQLLQYGGNRAHSSFRVHPQSRYRPTGTYGSGGTTARAASIFGPGFSIKVHAAHTNHPIPSIHQHYKIQITNKSQKKTEHAIYPRHPPLASSTPPVKGAYYTSRWSVPTPFKKKSQAAGSTDSSYK